MQGLSDLYLHIMVMSSKNSVCWPEDIETGWNVWLFLIFIDIVWSALWYTNRSLVFISFWHMDIIHSSTGYLF